MQMNLRAHLSIITNVPHHVRCRKAPILTISEESILVIDESITEKEFPEL